MRGRHRRFLSDGDDGDPLAGLTNLFDVAMVFAVALLVALVERLEIDELLTQREMTIVKNPGTEDMEILVKNGAEITTYGVDEITADSGSRGRRVGSAFQLEDGTIIYVPDEQGSRSRE